MSCSVFVNMLKKRSRSCSEKYSPSRLSVSASVSGNWTSSESKPVILTTSSARMWTIISRQKLRRS